MRSIRIIHNKLATRRDVSTSDVFTINDIVNMTTMNHQQRKHLPQLRHGLRIELVHPGKQQQKSIVSTVKTDAELMKTLSIGFDTNCHINIEIIIIPQSSSAATASMDRGVLGNGNVDDEWITINPEKSCGSESTQSVIISSAADIDPFPLSQIAEGVLPKPGGLERETTDGTWYTVKGTDMFDDQQWGVEEADGEDDGDDDAKADAQPSIESTSTQQQESEMKISNSEWMGKVAESVSGAMKDPSLIPRIVDALSATISLDDIDHSSNEDELSFIESEANRYLAKEIISNSQDERVLSVYAQLQEGAGD